MSARTVEDGRALAVEMLEEIEAAQDSNGEDENGCPLWGKYSWDAYCSDDDTGGRLMIRFGAQTNIVRDYLARCEDKAIDGFCSVLTDWIASVLAGAGEKALHVYEREPLEVAAANEA